MAILRIIRRLAAFAAMAVPLLVFAQGIPDLERGRALYENHCQVCHTPRVHSRANKLPVSQAELRDIVDRWQREEKLRWSGQDVTDVVEYLGRTRYGYAPQ